MGRSHLFTRFRYWFFSAAPLGQRVAQIASGIAMLIAFLVLLGWVLNFPPLKTMLVPGGGNMRANAALGLLLSGFSLSLLASQRRRTRITRVVQACTILAGAIGLLTLLQYAFGWNFGIDRLLFRDPFPNPPTLHPGRMSIAAALNLSSIGAALWLLCAPESSNHRHPPNRTRLNRTSIAQSLALIAGVIALQALLARTFGLPSSSWLGSAQTTMGGHTAFAFGILATGVLALRSNSGWMQILMGESIGSIVARHLIPVAIVTPLMLGLLILQGHRNNWYDANFAMSLMSVAFVLTTVGSIVRGAGRLNQVESARQRAVDRRRSSQARLQLAQAATHAATWEWNPRTNEVFWSESCYPLFGVSPAEPDPFPVFMSRIHAEDLPGFEVLAQQCATATDTVEIEYRYHHPDLGLRWIFDRASADANNPALIYGISFDITDRKQAELERAQNQETIRRQLAEIEAIYHTAPIGLAILDRDLRFVRINQRLAEINGLSIEDHLDRAVREIVPNIADEVEPLFRRVLETGEPLLNLEINGETAAQPGVQRTWIENWYPLRDAGGQIVGINVVVQEITQRKQAEIALREANQQIETIWESMSDAYTTLDREWRIVYANSTAMRLICQLTDRTPEEILGKTHWEVFPSTVGQPVEREYRRAMAGQVPVHLEFLYEPTEAWFEVSAYPSSEGLGLYYRDITKRKRAEAALRDREQQLQQLSDSMPQFVWTSNAGGALEYVNHQWCDYSGLTLEQCRRDPSLMAAHHHPEEVEQVFAQWAIAVETKQPFEFEGRLRSADGTYRWFLMRAVPILDEQGQVLRWYGTSTDIHDRKLNQLNDRFLNELDARLRQLTDADAMKWEIVSRLGEYLNVDRALWNEIDWENGSISIQRDWRRGTLPSLAGTHPLANFISPELQAAHAAGQPSIVSDVATDPQTAAYVSTYQRLNIGALVSYPCIHEGRWVVVISVNTTTPRLWQANEITLIQDITTRLWAQIEQTRAVQALRESEARFRTLADNIAQFAWIADANGEIFWYNQRWFDYTGTTLEEMQGWGWQAVHHPEYVDRVVEQFRHCIETGELWEDTFPLRDRDGNYRWFLSRAIPIRDRQGNIFRWFGTNTDISDRKQLEDTLAAQTEELIRTNRLKDEFLAALSHELRTPLHPILGWTQMMRAQTLTPAKTAEVLEVIERNVNQQIAIVDDLLDVSRAIQGKLNLKLHPVDLAIVVGRAIETVQFTARAKRIQIEFRDLVRLPVMADSDRLQQVFWNLLSNAIKFTPEGGRIEVGGSIFTNDSATRYAQIRVTDNGIGISPEFLPHVFEHFRQADGSAARKYGGLGLGLSIVRHLVELHGGIVLVESPGVGGGATFTVRLPLYTEIEASIVEPATQFPTNTDTNSLPEIQQIDLVSSGDLPEFSSIAALAGLLVLLVDDDRDNLDLLCFLLQEHGAIVTTATSPLAALDLIPKETPDLIVSDIGMPEIDGYDFIRRVRELPEGGQIPALALTAFAGQEDRQKACAAGFQAYIPKPVDPLELLTILAQLVPD